MKKLLSFVLILTMAVTMASGGVSIAEDVHVTAASSYETIFEKDKVIDIKIEIAEEDLASIYKNPELEEYHSANITVDGVTVNNIGIRTKGNSSLNSVTKSDSDRYSYRIKFNKYEKGQKLLGLDEMVINNMFSDASYMREYLSYEAMREAGLDAPLAVFANIYINGELTGFYLCVEAIEDAFLDRNFGNNDGNLYKQEQGSTLIYKENDAYQSSELKVGDDTEKTGLKNMIKVLNEGTNLDSVLDVDSALRYIAANTVLGSYDSYSGNFAHNYYLYEQDGQFTVIPWDYNMSFGGFSQGGSGWSTSLDTPVSGVSMEQRPLISKLLSVAEYKEKYLAYVKEFSAYLEKMPERVAEVAEIIRDYVEADPTKFTTIEKFESSIIYVEETEKADQGGMGGGRMGGPMSAGMPMETMQQAMEIISEAGTNALTEEQLQQLRDLGLTDEQITQFKSMGQRGGMGGQRPEFNTANETNNNGSESTRGNMGGGRGQGDMGGQRPEGLTPPDGTDIQNGNNQNRPGGGMGMGGGSIITFATKRLSNIKTQLNGEIGLSDLITVLPNRTKINFDTQPIIEDGRTLVPVRAIFEALGMTVSYDNGEISATKDDLTINLTVGSNIAFINGDEKVLDVASKIMNQRTFVPLRFIGEATGLTVSYDDETKTVSMNA